MFYPIFPLYFKNTHTTTKKAISFPDHMSPLLWLSGLELSILTYIQRLSVSVALCYPNTVLTSWGRFLRTRTIGDILFE